MTARAKPPSIVSVPLRRRQWIVLATSARAADAGDLVQRGVGHEVADVGHDPLRAGLDEQVVPQPVEVVA